MIIDFDYLLVNINYNISFLFFTYLARSSDSRNILEMFWITEP